MNAKEWLRSAGYDDVADNIRRLEARWRTQGKATRRNWWDVLAGKPDGDPIVIDGVTFPSFKFAKLRQGKR